MPPRLLRWLIRLALPADDRDAVAGELDLLYAARREARGRRSANLWFARQAAGFVLRVAIGHRLLGTQGIEGMLGDARASLRRFRREPAFACSFVITLAAVAGVLTAVFSAANWLVLRPVPGVREAGALFTMQIQKPPLPPEISWAVSDPDLETLQERLEPLATIAAFTPVDVDLRVGRALPRRVAAEMVSATYFRVLETRLRAGRGFAGGGGNGGPGSAGRAAGDEPGPVAVVSSDLASVIADAAAGEGNDPGQAVGATVRINGTTVRVIGVTEAGFRGAELPGRPRLWLPASALPILDPSMSASALTDRGEAIWARMVCRRAPNVTAMQVRTAANEVMTAVRKEFRNHSYRAANFEFAIFEGTGPDPAVRGTARRTLALLFGAAAFLLLLAAANLANLTIARVLRYRTAMAIRRALGATSARVIRSLLIEAVLLGTASAVLAVAVATGWNRWFRGLQLSEVGGSFEGVRLDGRVIAFAVLASVATAVLVYLRPAVRLRELSLEHLMRRSRGGLERQWMRAILLSVQVTLSVVLLVGATLLVRSIGNLRNVDLGFSSTNLLTAAVDPELHRYDRGRAGGVARDIETRLAQRPGIVAAGFVSPQPLGSRYTTGSLTRVDVAGAVPVIGAGYYVTPGFLAAVGVRTIAGDARWQGEPGTVVVTRSMIDSLFPGMAPSQVIGVTVSDTQDRPVRIAAVIEDLRLSDVTAPPPPTVFRPFSDCPPGWSIAVFVRAAEGSSRALPTLERAVAEAAPEVPVYDARPARDAVDLQFVQQRLMATIASTLGGLGVLLAAIGLYGVLANVVAAGQRDIAIRSSLGASPGRILTTVLARGIGPVVVGATLGVVGAVGAARLLQSQLFGLTALDPGAYVTSTGIILLVAAAACVAPAYRSTHVAVMDLLRSE